MEYSSFRILDAREQTDKQTAKNAQKETLAAQAIERFHSRDYRPYWFTETKESICIKIEFNSQRLSLWDTKMAAISLFWDTNMAAVTS